MPSKAEMYAQMASHVATHVTSSWQDWTAFLTTAARLYKYPYHEQLMIYAQRPEATACAEYDLWNDKMGRYIRRGSKGIALVDDSGDRPRLRYVFDVADTGTRPNSRHLYLWNMGPEHTIPVQAMLERRYDIGGDSLPQQLADVAAKLADEYWNDHQQEFSYIVDGSFLEEYDELNRGLQFKSAVTVSMTYALMSRCGLEPEQYFGHEDFMAIFDFNTPATVVALGTAVSQLNQQVLRQIGITIQNADREYYEQLRRDEAAIQERSQHHEERTELHEERGLPHSEPEPERTGEAAGQVREDAQSLPERTQADDLQQPAPVREAVPAPAGDRGNGGEPLGADDAPADERSRRDREPESQGPDAVGGADEQLQGAGGGNDFSGTYSQLSFFPTENEQIYHIDQAESAQQTPFAFSFGQEEIDLVLQLGANDENSRKRITAEFMKQKPLEEIATFLSREYRGGAGFLMAGDQFSAWFAEDGIHLSHGKTARYAKSAQVISWEDAARRIGELLEQGKFATNVELAETDGYERTQLAEAIWYLKHDFSDEANALGYLPSLSDIKGNGFPEETAWLADKLTDPAFRTAFTAEYERFLSAYTQERDMLRFHYHRPDQLLTRLQELDLPRRGYSTELSELPSVKRFITEDEVDSLLSGGSSVEGGKGRIYAYFMEPHTPKEQAAFLKAEYGWGGHNNALPGSFRSNENHDGKGIKIEKPGCEDIQLPWNTVAKRIVDLIRKDRYLTPKEQQQYAARQTEVPLPAKPPVSRQEITQDDIDRVLLDDWGAAGRKQRIAALYQSGQNDEQIAQTLLSEYNRSGFERENPKGGICKLADGREGYGYYVAAGLRLTPRPEGIQREISYPELAGHIRTLIDNGRYLTAEERAVLLTENQPAPPLRTATQADIDAALQEWNGDIASKHSVIRYMADHARDKDTAAWLKAEYGDDLPAFPVTADGAAADVPWPKVQRRIAQLIQSDQFYTQAERDNMDDIDPVAIRERLDSPEAQGEVDAMLAAAQDAAPVNEADRYERFAVIESENGYAIWDDLHDAYYVDEEGVTEEFDSEWLANDYLFQVREAVAQKEAAEWLAVEQGKVQADGTPDMEQLGQEISSRGLTASEEQLANGLEEYRSRGGRGDSQDIADFIEDNYLTDGHTPELPVAKENFHIMDEHLGEGGPKVKFRANMDAIHLLKELEAGHRQATPEEQQILSGYVGWGGVPDAFDEGKPAWAEEYAELKAALTPSEYDAARASTLNAHYTSPAVIRAVYEAVGRMGFTNGNILEPAMGVGNFFGMLPEQMQGSRLYGVELDSISGRIAGQLYPKANITVAGFETTDRRDFFDLAVGNVPFGQYKVNDRAYNKLGFTIHNYFFAKALDQVRPGGVVAFVTSRYTMDSKDSTVRKYLAQRAELLGAIRLPNNAFKANAGTEVVSDILFLQKRDRPMVLEPDWVHAEQNEDGFPVNDYFLEHPEMVLGRQTSESTAHGMDYTVAPIEGLELSDQLHDAVKYIRGTYTEAELPELGGEEAIDTTLPADPDVKNYSYTVVEGNVYFRENSVMVRPELNATAEARIKGMVALRDCVHGLIDLQMDDYTPNAAILDKQAELNRLYDDFSEKYGLLNDRANRLAFSDDSSYYLLCALEVLDEDGNLERKADMFTKRTIQPHKAVTSVDTASEALAVSISEKARVDMTYMSELSGKTTDEIAADLAGVIFKDPAFGNDPLSGWQTADEYLSGNVRQKLRAAQRAADRDPAYAPNVEALKAAQPKDLDASEIEVRLGATWIDKDYIRQFMYETFDTPRYLRGTIDVNYANYTAEWQITGKTQVGYNDVAAYTTYGTDRANAYRILEDSLNLRDVRIYDTVEDEDGKEKRVLNAKETTLAAQKQQAIRDAFKDWIWKDPERRQTLVRQYNEEMNSTRPREYDGSHIILSGMNPEIRLREHQKNAIAHVLYGGNTLLAHEVGAGKTFEMVAAAMESKRLGLCRKSIFVVPNHLTEQWASEFLRLYPSANILVTTKKDFETHNRKKFCSRIATGDYDAVIIGHSQFERIPISKERQERLLRNQIWEITEGISEVEESGGERFTVKQLERTKKGLEARLEKLQASDRKDDVITFEQLGCDRMFVDESHNYKNLFLYTKMRNVAGLSTTDAQKSSDMFAKCRYMDELTGSRGVVFATGTPVSNSMTELYTIQRYLQYERLEQLNMVHFDCWASRFGETATALELAPEGTGYRARTRFSKFFNLPELMNLFKEVADIKTADQLHLPTPEVEYHNIVAQPTEHQQEMVQALSERAARVHSGSIDPSVDNMLKITSDGRKLGLDQRIINSMLPDEDGTKVNQCVQNIMQIWQDGQNDKLTQLVFCDISTPKAAPARKVAKAVSGNLDNPELHGLETAIDLPEPEAAFTVYEDIRQKLIAQGVPSDQVAFIHEANTEVRKKELFAKVRTGQVRVLLGSTSKMGAGTNVQDRLVALHDLDCPWRPGDLAQRKGRIERQGNNNEKVHVFRYVTEGTFDAYLWQTVENKQKFISQIMTSKSPVRSCEDVDETALSFAEIKALCAGDPRIKERMDLDVEVSRLKIMKADHQSKQFRLEDNLLKYFPEKIEANKGFIKGLQADMETLAAHPHPEEGFAGMEVRGDTLTDKENAGAALLDACKEVKDKEPVQIGSYRGFSMFVHFNAFEKAYELSLRGQMSHRVELGADARGNLVRIDNALAQMPERLNNVQVQLDNLYQQQAAAKAEVGKPFPQEGELQSKTARLVELDSILNMDGRKPMPEAAIAKSSRPSVLENLRAAQSQKPATEKKTKQHEEVR